MAFKISGFGASQKEEKSIAPTYETDLHQGFTRDNGLLIGFVCRNDTLFSFLTCAKTADFECHNTTSQLVVLLYQFNQYCQRNVEDRENNDKSNHE